MATLADERMLVMEDDHLIASEMKVMVAHAGVAGPAALPAAPRAAGRRPFDTRPRDAGVLDVDLNGATSFMLADRLTATWIAHLIVADYDGSSLLRADRAIPRLTKPRADAVTIATVSARCGQGDKE